MAIGERIRFIRNLRGMTQKRLGIAVGYPEQSADIRMAQYESGSRGPKSDLIKKLAEVLEVSTDALTAPNIDNVQGVMHTLFALEDLYGLQVDEADGQIVLRLNEKRADEDIQSALRTWLEHFLDWRLGDISRDKYDEWRYNFAMHENYEGK